MTDASVVFRQDLVLTDHSKVYYAPFRKNFYVEIPELARLTPEGTNCHVLYYNGTVLQLVSFYFIQIWDMTTQFTTYHDKSTA